MKLYHICLFICIGCLVFTGCSEKEIAESNGQDTDSLSFTVERAPEWTALFKRNSGWFGADGIFSVPLNGKEAPGTGSNSKSLLLFSDTMIGDAVQGAALQNSSMVNNTVAILEGDQPIAENISFYWEEDQDGNPQTMFVPQTESAEEGAYYWLGDGFVNTEMNNDIYFFAYRMQKTGGVFGFEEVGNVLIKVPAGSTPPFENHQQIETPFYLPPEGDRGYISFGAGIFVNTEEAGAPDPDGYIYVYGVENSEVKKLLTARVEPEHFEDFSEWRFWDGDGWNPDLHSAEPVTDQVSNELSVYPVAEDKYALIFQVNGIGNNVGMRIGETPAGPFGEIRELWNTEEVTGKDEDFYAYNAKAHPNLSQPGELLISYNVNSLDFFADIEEYPHLYRPRFIRLKY